MDDNTKYAVEISDRARRMLLSHVRFLADVNTSAADRLVDRLMEGIRSLSFMPERCPFFQEDFIPPNKYHKLYIEKWYLVLYQIKNRTVYVEYIVDCRQDYKWLMK